MAAGSGSGAMREHAVTSRLAASVASARADRPRVRLRGRPMMALVLAPEPPLEAWLDELTTHQERSPAFFSERPVVLDLSALPVRPDDLAALGRALAERQMRVVALESSKAGWVGVSVAGLPAVAAAGRGARTVDPPDSATGEGAGARATALLLDEPVRSGQSIVFPAGDVTIVGSVASGAEVVAGGSIHVYGALRGRAIAGSVGNPAARIFCRRLEAELLAIDGLYKTADTMAAELRGRAVQAWLEGEALRIAPLD